MIHMQEMTEFMNDHIINDLDGRHREAIVESEMLRRAAAAPFRFGLLDHEGSRRDFQLLLINSDAFRDHLLAACEVKFLQIPLKLLFRSPVRLD